MPDSRDERNECRMIEITPEIRAVLDTIPKVRVHVYRHPDWDDRLILKADEEVETSLDRQIAKEYLSEESDPDLLTVETDWMNKADFDALREFCG
jgi:hypothetical protein